MFIKYRGKGDIASKQAIDSPRITENYKSQRLQVSQTKSLSKKAKHCRSHYGAINYSLTKTIKYQINKKILKGE